MFQVAFLSTFVAAHQAKPDQLSSAYGFPIREKPSDMPIEEMMVKTIKEIYAVSSWPEFFNKVHFGGGLKWGKVKFSQVLRDCVRKSEAAGYHTRCRGVKALQDDRVRKEGAWAKARQRA